MAGRGLVSGSRRTKFRRVDGAELRQSPPATITSLDNAPQSKLRSSAQRLLRLLCASNAQKMQINRDFTLSLEKGSALKRDQGD